MDPLTHAIVGASAARVLVHRARARVAVLAGGLGAILPDLDTLIRSGADPLLQAEFHRHFTHSLVFIPIGGVVASLPWLLDRRRPRREKSLAVTAGVVGCGTHGLLDASTTYGTLLLWPFSDRRIGWSWISIIDPLFTLLLTVGLLAALARRSPAPAAIALVLALAYLGLGSTQRQRALAAQERIAGSRGHAVQRSEAFPTFANNVVWRSLYLAGDTLHFDRIRVPWAGRRGWQPGSATPLFRPAEVAPELLTEPRLRRDLERFHWFAGGWVALDPGDPTLIGDARYSRTDDDYQPVWGIRLHAGGGEVRTEWVDRSLEREVDGGRLAREVLGRVRFLELP
jgi:inner membrane protein